MSIETEKRTINIMIQMYCKSECQSISLCDDCQNLLLYAEQRLDNCHWGNKKPTCKKCSTHCYKSDMKEKMRSVMRFSGPRLIFKHPILALRHLLR